MISINYFLDILSLNGEAGEDNHSFSRMKLFSFFKSFQTDAHGIGVLKQGNKVCTSNVDQANLLHSQLAQLCNSKLLSGAVSLVI